MNRQDFFITLGFSLMIIGLIQAIIALVPTILTNERIWVVIGIGGCIGSIFGVLLLVISMNM